jgi:arginine repressor
LPKPVRPRDVLAALAEQGIDVSRAQISAVLAGMGMRRRRRRRGKVVANGNAAAAYATAATSPALTLQSLLAAKRLADQLGSVDAAKQAVDALAKLS